MSDFDDEGLGTFPDNFTPADEEEAFRAFEREPMSLPSAAALTAEQLAALARAKLLLEAWGYKVLLPGEARPVGGLTPAPQTCPTCGAPAVRIQLIRRGEPEFTWEHITPVSRGAPTPAMIAAAAQALWITGNQRIGYRAYTEALKRTYEQEAEVALRAALTAREEL